MLNTLFSSIPLLFLLVIVIPVVIGRIRRGTGARAVASRYGSTATHHMSLNPFRGGMGGDQLEYSVPATVAGVPAEFDQSWRHVGRSTIRWISLHAKLSDPGTSLEIHRIGWLGRHRHTRHDDWAQTGDPVFDGGYSIQYPADGAGALAIIDPSVRSAILAGEPSSITIGSDGVTIVGPQHRLDPVRADLLAAIVTALVNTWPSSSGRSSAADAASAF